jgi:YVTN family beta-propeller protein
VAALTLVASALTLAVGASPASAATATAPRAYVANFDSNTVSVIDTATNTVVATVAVGIHPLGVAVNPAGTRAYVANYDSNNVSVIDTATNTVVATVAVGILPETVAVNPAGTRAYVTNFGSNTVSVIDTGTNAVVATVAVGFHPFGVAVNPAGTRVYVANIDSNTVSVIDTATDTVVATVAVGIQPLGVAVNPAGTRVYVTNIGSNNVSVIDTATDAVVATVAVGTGPEGVAVNPAGTRAYVTNRGSNNVSVIDTATNTVVATVVVGARPEGVAVNPAGTRAYVTNYDSNNVSVIDTATNTVVATVAVGSGPFGVGVANVTITNASPSISTQASAGGPVGTALTDSATVAGGSSPTGTVMFKLFSDTSCTTQVGATSTKTVSGGTATSDPITTTAPGTYYWTAVYSGDANNNGATGACQAANESVTITKASPSISTQASAGGPVGTALTDSATVAGGFNPTGNVTFKLFSDTACATQVFTSTNALSGPSATSGPDYTPTAPGTYYWTAAYPGDANNNGATGACQAANESVTITKASPTISTQASPGNLLGAPVRDVGTLAGGLNPTGGVTFALFSDASCATQVFTSNNNLAGLTATSDWFTPAAAGTYRWTAVYGGDANNNTATSACNAPNESVVIAPFVARPPTRTITGDFLGPFTVNAGESVLIIDARVVGPVTVNPGGALSIVNSQISRGVNANAPAFLSICGTSVSGPSPNQALGVSGATVPIRIGDPATGCAGNRFAGDVNLSANLAVTFGANAVSGNVNINNNGPGSTVIKANTIHQALACAGNNPPTTNAGQPNTAASKTGQCATL